MSTMLKSLSCAALALAVFSIGPASAERAEQDGWSRRVVGVPTPSYNNNAPVQSNGVNLWFGQGQQPPNAVQGNRDFFNYFFNNAPRTQSTRNQDFNIEPEIDSSSNVPIYDYEPEPMMALGRSDLKKQAVPSGPVFSASNADGPNQGVRILAEQRANADPLASSIYDQLKQSASGVRVTKDQNTAITEFYAARNFKPLWTTAEGLTPKARDVLDLLSRAEEEGLVAADYLPPALGGFDGALKDGQDGPVALADAELGMTAMALRYAQHASGGRIAPNRLSGYFDLKPPKVGGKVALDRLAQSESPSAYLRGLQPSHFAYAALKKALKDLLDEPDTPVVNLTVEDGPTIRPGESDDRIPVIRTRLMKLGHLETTIEAASDTPSLTPVSVTGDDAQVSVITVDGVTQVDVAQSEPQVVTVGPEGDTTYDPLLEKALKEFQKSSGLRADGLIGSRTVAALNGGVNVNTRPVQKQKIQIAMERLRWLPRDFGSRYVQANQAAFEVYVVENGREVWQSRVIVGKRQNQTAEFNDEMETVVFNPYWGVPQSIIVNEMLPYLRRDPSYLDRNGYEVTNDSGRRISSSSVNWWQFGDSVPLNVRQPPGSDNALGEVKFLFPNEHSIYMHDTPSKPLFSKPSRAFSHGCVRVQNPRQFAEVLLGWSSGEVAMAIEDRQNKEVKLPRKVPVYLTYFTAWPDAAGNVRFYEDVYGRDELVQTAAAKTDRVLRGTQ